MLYFTELMEISAAFATFHNQMLQIGVGFSYISEVLLTFVIALTDVFLSLLQMAELLFLPFLLSLHLCNLVNTK